MVDIAKKISKKVGDMSVTIPVTDETLRPYLQWVASECGSDSVTALVELDELSLKNAINALYINETFDKYACCIDTDITSSILEKIGNMAVTIPVTDKTLQPYLQCLVLECGSDSIINLEKLNETDLRASITALYCHSYVTDSIDMESSIETIIEKVGNMSVAIPVTKETLRPYLQWLVSKRGASSVYALSKLNKFVLQDAIVALFQCESIDKFIGHNNSDHDVMTNIERHTNINIEMVGK